DLKDRAVAHAEHAHGEKKEGNLRGERQQAADRQEKNRETGEKDKKQAVTTDLVGEPATHRAQEAAREDDHRGEIPSANFRKTVLMVKKNGQETRESDEATEREAIEEAKPCRVGLAQDGRKIFPGGRLALARAVFCEKSEEKHDENSGQHGESERVGR